MGAARFLWSPGAAAAEGGRVWPAAAACAAAAFAQGAALKCVLLRPEFSHQDSPPIPDPWWAVGLNVALVALLAWFIRSTVLEIALDWPRKLRNMRPNLRAEAWISAIAGTMGALWGFVAVLAVPRGASPVIISTPDSPLTEAHVAPTLWVLILPFAAFWIWRAVWDGRAAAKLYGRSAILTVAASLVAGFFALLFAFYAVTSATAQYDRISHAFRG
ncbi:MAG: hypothetical protein K8T20_15960 [Planctomycetes bacterium]|nr:hypothetical protein [Planctomycetota bacterium]